MIISDYKQGKLTLSETELRFAAAVAEESESSEVLHTETFGLTL